jgi:hypothetical protein
MASHRHRTEPMQSEDRMPEDDMRAQDRSTLWLPLVVVVALLVGAGLYYFGHRMANGTPNVQAEGGAVTKSPRSPN